MSINVSALQNSGYVLENVRTYAGRSLSRYSLPLDANIATAVSAIKNLLKDNGDLFFVNPELTKTLPELLNKYKILVINGNKLCLSDTTQAPEDLPKKCRDVCFTDGYVSNPARCAQSDVVFERRYLEVWLRSHHNSCPCGISHELELERDDPYLRLEVQEAKVQYEKEELETLEIVKKIKSLENATRVVEVLVEAYEAMPKPKPATILFDQVRFEDCLIFGKALMTTSSILKHNVGGLFSLPIAALIDLTVKVDDGDMVKKIMNTDVAHEVLCLEKKDKYTKKQLDAAYDTLTECVNPDKTKVSLQKWIDAGKTFLYSHYQVLVKPASS